jgi:hypothetical protein
MEPVLDGVAALRAYASAVERARAHLELAEDLYRRLVALTARTSR